MKVIISGSKQITTPELFEAAIKESGFDITAIVSGGIYGVDTMAERYAEKHGLPIYSFHPDYKNKTASVAKYERNLRMLAVADAIIAIWDGIHRNTRYLLWGATKERIPIYVKYIGDTTFADYSNRTIDDVYFPPPKENIHDIAHYNGRRYIGEGFEDLRKVPEAEAEAEAEDDSSGSFFEDDYEEAYNRLIGSKLF